jgi:pyruvate,water dikinase
LTAYEKVFEGEEKMNRAGHNLTSGEWNDSLAGHYLWTNTNFGEANPGVMTPYTWSIIRLFFEDVRREIFAGYPKGYLLAGNIGGRVYLNVSLGASVGAALGVSEARFRQKAEAVAGHIPDDLEIPLISFPRWWLLRKHVLPSLPRLFWRLYKAKKDLPAFIANAPDLFRHQRDQIQLTQAPDELIARWHDELEPLLRHAFIMLHAGMYQIKNRTIRLQNDLTALVGEADANALLSSVNKNPGELAGTLASLGPLLGLTNVARGEMTREAYAQQFGHRGPNELELSIPRPAEDPTWIERQLAELARSGKDVETLLARQKAGHDAAWERFKARYPRKVKSFERRLAQVAEGVKVREASRSEFTRMIGLARDFARHAGELTGLGDDIFFLELAEVLALLAGDKSATAFIPTRQETDARYRALPPYPTLIKGHFDLFKWAADPNRRSDVFDADAPAPAPSNGVVKGFPGAAGIIEGLVRVLSSVEEGEQLRAGEILVTTTTNVGWTPLFVRAGALVTDVGAPLSHTAIVARELGIPAVVGCGNATMHLRTGDRVRVDGGRGTVEVLTVFEDRR